MGVQKSKRPLLSQGHVWPNDRGVIQGLWDYDNTLSSQSAVQDTWLKLNNNGLGDQSTNEFAYPYASHIFNTTTNQFDFSNLEIGDTVDIRFTTSVVTPNNNQSFKVSLFAGIGEFEYELPIISEIGFKQQGTHLLGGMLSLYIGNNLTKNNPAEIRLRTDAAATITVDGWFVRAFALKRFN